MDFEQEAERIDGKDDEFSDVSFEISSKYKTYGRPYLVAAGYEEGVKYIFTMSSLMTKVIADAEFIQCDITRTTHIIIIFNAVAFNKVSICMEWMVVA